jgi:WD40 repeat protein
MSLKESLALLIVLASFTTSPGTSFRKAETFGEWSTPKNVGGPVNTDSNDTYAIFSRDELTIYFTSDRPGGLGGDDLWFATRESVESPWGQPQNLNDVSRAPINTDAADSLAVLSSDEHVMFFHSTRPGGCGPAILTGDIWMTRRHDRRTQEWETPTRLGCDPVGPNTGTTEIAPAFFENPETGDVSLYYGSNRSPSTGFDVYKSPVGEDRHVGPGELVPEFSSPGRDTRIFIRRDGLEAFITSDRTGGVGAIDIWTSTRETLSDLWLTPVDLPSPVNTTSDDGSPSLSRDGTTLFFFSTRDGGYGKRDIWYTTRAKIDPENRAPAMIARL